MAETPSQVLLREATRLRAIAQGQLDRADRMDKDPADARVRATDAIKQAEALEAAVEKLSRADLTTGTGNP